MKKNDVVNIQVRVRRELKENAEDILKQLDLSLADAFRLFLNEIYRNKRVPVDLSLKKHSFTQLKQTLNKQSKFPDMNDKEFSDWWERVKK